MVYNYDPEYQYLLDSLNLAQMKAVGLVAHPGTTVQVIGALVLRTTHLFKSSSKDDLQADVLRNPEYYLAIINKVFLSLNTLALFILGIATFWLTRDLLLCIVVQSSIFSPHILEGFLQGLNSIRPETLLILSSLLFLIMLILFYNKDTEKSNYNFINAIFLKKSSQASVFTICFSLVSGFGMATKVTFIPILVIPLIILPTYRLKIKYILGTVFSFIFFTLPISKEYDQFFSWLFTVATHSDVHGMGPKKIIEPSIYLTNVKFILLYNRFFSIILFSSICILLIGFTVPRFRKVSKGNMTFRLLSGVSLCQLIGVMITARHYRGAFDNYYLISILCFSSFMLMLIFDCIRQLIDDFRIERSGALTMRKRRNAILRLSSKWLFYLIIISCLFYSRKNEVIGFYKWRSRLTNHILAVTNKVENEYEDYAKIYYLGSSAPAIALAHGDSTSRRANSQFLQKLYPNVYFYDYYTGKYSYWSKEKENTIIEVPLTISRNEVSIEEILTKYDKKIIFQGPLFEDIFTGLKGGWKLLSHKKPDLPLKVIIENTSGTWLETIYELDLSSENELGIDWLEHQ